MRTLLASLTILCCVASGCVSRSQRGDFERTEEVAVEPVFTAEPIPDAVFGRMRGLSYPEGCTVSRDDLSYLRVSHYDFGGCVREGEIVCSRELASDLLDIMRELFEQEYPIESLRLVDDFGADDARSMAANNSSCFNYRTVAGSRTLSRHAYGTAIDINPLYNPCVRPSGLVQPEEAASYADRTRDFAHKIDRNDAAYRIFTAHGWRWGGAWRSVKDYQHFEK